jgi:hypothetical protein
VHDMGNGPFGWKVPVAPSDLDPGGTNEDRTAA